MCDNKEWQDKVLGLLVDMDRRLHGLAERHDERFKAIEARLSRLEIDRVDAQPVTVMDKLENLQNTVGAIKVILESSRAVE